MVVTAKSQGCVDTGVSIIDRESILSFTEPEVVFRDPSSSASSLVTTLRVDTGLSWLSACMALNEALRDPATKSTTFGGSTGFWRQARSSRVVLAIEMASTSLDDRRQRMHRVLRPTLHTSSKPQYVPGPKLRDKYVCVRDRAEAQRMWANSYDSEESTRVKEVHLLSGAILPVWNALVSALHAQAPHKRELTLQVRKCEVGGKPLIGIALSGRVVDNLKHTLASQLGSRDGDVAAQRTISALSSEAGVVNCALAGRLGATHGLERSSNAESSDDDDAPLASSISFAIDDEVLPGNVSLVPSSLSDDGINSTAVLMSMIGS